MEDYNAMNVTQESDITSRLEGVNALQDSQDENVTSNDEVQDDDRQPQSPFGRHILRRTQF